MGPSVCSGLKSRLGAGKVGCQGVGGAYAAGLETNVLPAGATDAAIKVADDHFAKAASKCPQAKLLGGGYRYSLPRVFIKAARTSLIKSRTLLTISIVKALLS
jgi:Cutinase